MREIVDDAPVLGDFISALLAEKNDDDNFSFNKTYLKRASKYSPTEEIRCSWKQLYRGDSKVY